MSLAAQRARIVAWCDATGSELVEIVEDAGVSGTRPLPERGGGATIASLLQSRTPSTDAVVIARLDRLGRDAAETLTWLREFSRGRVGLVSITDRVDLATPQGRAMAGVSAVFAELERALIAQRTAEALTELKAQGRIYGPVPFGYRAHEDYLVAEPDEQVVLRQIARLRKRGRSYARIAEMLNARGVPAKRGGKWHAMSVRSVERTSAGLSKNASASASVAA